MRLLQLLGGIMLLAAAILMAMTAGRSYANGLEWRTACIAAVLFAIAGLVSVILAVVRFIHNSD